MKEEEKAKAAPEIKLDLMDWKNIENQAEAQIREQMAAVRLSELARMEAKKMIKSFKGGKTSEEEKADEKKFHTVKNI